MNKQTLRLLVPLLVVFVIINALIIAGASWLAKEGIDREVLIIGNLVICAATVISLVVLLGGTTAGNPQRFVRSMYGSFLIRFFLILIAAFIYIMTAKKDVNKPALVICAGLYILYAGLEISSLLRSMKKNRNA